MFYALLFPPLIGFFINGFRFKSKNIKVAGGVACSAMAISFFSALFYFFKLTALPVDERSIEVLLFNWIQVGDFSAPMAFTIDPLPNLQTSRVNCFLELAKAY